MLQLATSAKTPFPKTSTFTGSRGEGVHVVLGAVTWPGGLPWGPTWLTCRVLAWHQVTHARIESGQVRQREGCAARQRKLASL